MLEFMDGFDHYNNATNIARKWDAGSTLFGSVAGRFGGNAITQTNNGTGATVTLTSQATRTVGLAWQTNSLSNAITIVILQDSGTNQVDLRMTTAGQLQVTRNGTVLGISASGSPLAVNTWYYIEFQATIDPTVGAYTVRVTMGGVTTTWISGTGQNTRNTANSSSNQVRIVSSTSTTETYDDLYVLNSSGSVNNTFLGESRIFTSLPTGDDATYKQWTPSAGTNHYANVNQNPPDDDTTYNSSTTPGQIDLFTFPAISPTGPVTAVQVVLCERKDDVGARTTAVEYRSSGGTNYVGVNNFSPGSSYLMDRQIYETDPATSAAWTVSGVNGGEFGINCIA